MVDNLPILAPPGAGIPAVERLVAKFIIFNFRLKKSIDAPALYASYQQSLTELMRAAELFPENMRSVPILVPRLRGLEDSSRYYAPAMVLEHIALVDQGISQIVSLLGQGIIPPKAPGTADVKPRSGVIWQDAVTKIMAASAAFQNSLAADFTCQAALSHPWFGPLNAWQWAQFTVIHHDIHLSQLRKMYQLI